MSGRPTTARRLPGIDEPPRGLFDPRTVHLRGGDGRWELDRPPLGAGGRRVDARARGLPPPALALPAQRGEGRLPGRRVLQGCGDAARSKRAGGGRALSVCARAPHPPNRTLLLVSRREVSCAAVGASCSVTSVSVEIAGALPDGHQAIVSLH